MRIRTALCERWGYLCAVLSARKQLTSLPAAVAEEVLEDDNPFVRWLAGGAPVSDLLRQAALRDLDVLYRVSALTPERWTQAAGEELAAWLPRWGAAAAEAPLDKPWGECLEALAGYHLKTAVACSPGITLFYGARALLLPVEHPDPIRLSHLKGYEYQRGVAVKNTLALLDGFESNNMLLYGDRGTGKSSTVKALLNEYAPLRMIEMPRSICASFPI